MLHGGPLLETASMRDLGDGEGGYMADALGRTMLLPTDMDELRKMRTQEVFLSAKRYLGMIRFLETQEFIISRPGFIINYALISLARLSRPPTEWRRR